MRTQVAYFVLSLIGVVAAACAPDAGAPQPPDIAYGIDVCAACNMIIAEPRFAAASLTADGAMNKFDDIGDMLAFHAEHSDVGVRAFFVHDYNIEEWMRGEPAFYVRSSRLHTPMGHGIAAFGNRGAAQAFAAGTSGTLLTFDELRSTVGAAAHGH